MTFFGFSVIFLQKNMYFHCRMDILAFKNPFWELPISIPSYLHNRGSILEKTEISVFFAFFDICARKWPNPAEFGEHPFTFFILECQICTIIRKFCIFGKGRGMVQICTISGNFCIFAYVDCGNVDRKVCVQICIISWTFCIFAPCHTPCQICNVFRIFAYLTSQDKKVNGCSPNSAGCPVLAELTVSAAEH